MTTLRQIEANRRNALMSTGPKTEQGKQRSRRNALRHGLTAETVIEPLENPEEYVAFEASIVADYTPQTTTERALVCRLASLMWRIRRATAIETRLLQIQAAMVKSRRDEREAGFALDRLSSSFIKTLFRPSGRKSGALGDVEGGVCERQGFVDPDTDGASDARDLT